MPECRQIIVYCPGVGNLAKQIEYWYVSAGRERKAAEALFISKRYDASLFFCHLALEKLIKGLVVIKTKKPAPYSHNLPALAELAKVNLTDNQRGQLRIITTFNIAARYDDEKQAFYRKCTKDYAKRYLTISNSLYLWLKRQYPKR
jgi:HEPN domain-containing protein